MKKENGTRGETEERYGEERARMSVKSERNKLAGGSFEEKGDFILKAGREGHRVQVNGY